MADPAPSNDFYSMLASVGSRQPQLRVYAVDASTNKRARIGQLIFKPGMDIEQACLDNYGPGTFFVQMPGSDGRFGPGTEVDVAGPPRGMITPQAVSAASAEVETLRNELRSMRESIAALARPAPAAPVVSTPGLTAQDFVSLMQAMQPAKATESTLDTLLKVVPLFGEVMKHLTPRDSFDRTLTAAMKLRELTEQGGVTPEKPAFSVDGVIEKLANSEVGRMVVAKLMDMKAKQGVKAAPSAVKPAAPVVAATTAVVKPSAVSSAPVTDAKVTAPSVVFSEKVVEALPLIGEVIAEYIATESEADPIAAAQQLFDMLGEHEMTAEVLSHKHGTLAAAVISVTPALADHKVFMVMMEGALRALCLQPAGDGDATVESETDESTDDDDTDGDDDEGEPLTVTGDSGGAGTTPSANGESVGGSLNGHQSSGPGRSRRTTRKNPRGDVQAD